MTMQIERAAAAGGEPGPHPEGPRPPIGDDPAERKPEEKLPGKPVQPPPGEGRAGELACSSRAATANPATGSKLPRDYRPLSCSTRSQALLIFVRLAFRQFRMAESPPCTTFRQ